MPVVAPQDPSKTPASVSSRMRRQRSRDTGAELALRQLLHARGLRYRVHVRPVRGVRAEVDIVFGPARVAVLVDGCFWHGCPLHATWPKANAEWWRNKIEGNRARDGATDRALGEAGWLVLRVWEHEAPAEAAARIQQVVLQRRPPRSGGTATPDT